MKYNNPEEFEKVRKIAQEKEVKKLKFIDQEGCENLIKIGKEVSKSQTLPKIAYCFMTLNRFDEMKTAIEKVYDYVDKIIAVDGGSVDGSIEYLKGLKKCDLVERRWSDEFDVQRNQYLNHVLANYPDYWILVSDTDEWYSEKFMENLKYIILAAEKNKVNRLGIMSWFKVISAPDSPKAYEKPIDGQIKGKPIDKLFYKKLCFKAQEGMMYVKSPHEGLLGKWDIWNLCHLDWYFEHVKTRKSEVERGCRNYFVAGPGMSKNEAWNDFRKMADKYGWKLWSDMSSAMIKGDLPDDILKWIWSRKDWQEDGPPSSEQREYWLFYYDFIHPDKVEEDKKRLEL